MEAIKQLIDLRPFELVMILQAVTGIILIGLWFFERAQRHQACDRSEQLRKMADRLQAENADLLGMLYQNALRTKSQSVFVDHGIDI